MKYFLGAAALFAASVSADLCIDGSTDDGGNYYCQLVKAITYTNVGGSATYNRVTSMDSSSGTCSSEPFHYSGSLAPLNEPVSWHFRGPTNLKQFAVYMPSSDSSSKSRRETHERRHAHGYNHMHLHHAARHASPVQQRDVGSEVIATMDGKVVSWVNEYTGQATAAPAAGGSDSSSEGSSSGSGSTGGSTGGDAVSTPIEGGGWVREAYYDAESGVAEGLVFLNHEGGSGSGVFDYTFGNSLSYASKDGTTGAASPQVLSDLVTASSTEVIIMSDKLCGAEDGACGYYRPGTVAHQGFGGANKAFFMEFSMPSTGEKGASEYVPVDMPAIWMLNALIPLTLQYGNEQCSCWTTGCGEFDVFEVLAAGDSRMKSTMHGNLAGGDSDYFARPTSGTMKAAVFMQDDSIHIKVLDDDVTFGKTMPTSSLNDFIKSTLDQGDGVSLFSLGG